MTHLRQRGYLGEAKDYSSVVKEYAQEGFRILYTDKSGKKKTLWAGLGNRSGLGSYVNEVLSKKWRKSGERMIKKFKGMPKGTKIVMQAFRNINRDRGKWESVKSFVI